MKRYSGVAVLVTLLVACGASKDEENTNNNNNNNNTGGTDASVTNPDALRIDAKNGLTVQDGRVSGAVLVKKGSTTVKKAALTINDVPVPQTLSEESYDISSVDPSHHLLGTGAGLGQDLVLKATYQGETETLTIRCADTVDIVKPTAGTALTAGSTVTVEWSRVLTSTALPGSVWLSLINADMTDPKSLGAIGSHRATVPSDKASVDLTVPNPDGRDSYRIHLGVTGNKVKDAEGSEGFCQVIISQINPAQ